MTTRKFGRTLLVAVLALSIVLSITGGTIAWFTDEVTSAGNTIQAGTLDAKVYASDNGETWTEVTTGSAPIFNYDKWEPGYTTYKFLKIENAGNLAFKFQLNIKADSAVTGDYKLADVIDVYTGTAAPNRENLGTKVGTLTELMDDIDGAAYGVLEAGKGTSLCITLKMQETAGNDYQGLSVGEGFSLQLLATQATVESDSFGIDYDKDATYSVDTWSGSTDDSWFDEAPDGTNEYVINTAEQLADFAARVNAGETFDGKTIKLGNNIDLGNRAWTPIGRIGTTSTDFTYAFKGTFDGQDHTISNLNVSNEGWTGLFGIAYKANFKNVKLENVTLNSNRMTGSLVGQLYGSIDNCHVKNAVIKVVPNAVANGFDNGDKVGGIVGWLGDNGNNHYIKNCSAANVTLKAYRDVGGITGYIGTSTTVEGCKVDGVKILVDQVTNSYGAKDINAGGVVGRRYTSDVTVQNNTENNVAIHELKGAGNAQELAAVLSAGESAVLNADVTVSGTMEVLVGKDVILDLNGHDLSYAVENDKAAAIINNKGNLEITGEGTISFVAANPDLGAIPAYATNTITNTGVLTIGEGVTVTNGSEGGASYAVDNHGVFYLNGGTLIGDRCALRVAKYNQDNVEFVMNGGRVEAKTPAWIQLPNTNSSVAPKISVTINGGTMQSTHPTSADNNVMYTYSYGNSHANTNITINGGEFLGGTVSIGSGYKGDAPSLTINGGTFEYDVLQWLENDGSQVLFTANK